MLNLPHRRKPHTSLRRKCWIEKKNKPVIYLWNERQLCTLYCFHVIFFWRAVVCLAVWSIEMLLTPPFSFLLCVFLLFCKSIDGRQVVLFSRAGGWGPWAWGYVWALQSGLGPTATLWITSTRTSLRSCTKYTNMKICLMFIEQLICNMPSIVKVQM